MSLGRGPLLSIVIPLYNEEASVPALLERLRGLPAERLGGPAEIVFVDDHSSDRTSELLHAACAGAPGLRYVRLAANRGSHVAILAGLERAQGACAVFLAADLQDPPELIPAFLGKWREGYKVVLGIKEAAEESALMSAIRRAGYGVIDRLSEVRQVRNSTGFGLYDKAFVAVLRRLPDPYPYFRGIVAELGFRYATVPYTQPQRKRGITKNNLYTLYDLGVQGIVNHSRIPLRVATIIGFISSVITLLAALVYFVMKMLFWYNLPIGVAPVIIGLFCVASVQLFFLGVLGEYVGSIYTQVRNRPLVVEQERINFDDDPAG